MTDTLVTMITYVVLSLLCYGMAYLISVDPHVVVSYAALALTVDAQMRVD
jgi:hypothetical protein